MDIHQKHKGLWDGFIQRKIFHVKSSLFHHILKARRQEAAIDHAIIYINCTKYQYLNSNGSKLKLCKKTNANKTMLSTAQLFHKKKFCIIKKVKLNKLASFVVDYWEVRTTSTAS